MYIPEIPPISANLYAVLKLTPGYLWRDPYFIGVIPAYEWAHPRYDDAAANWRFALEYCSMQRVRPIPAGRQVDSAVSEGV